MALFVDGPSPTIDGLIDQDSGLLDVAETCGINLTTKLRLGHEEIATDLELWLQRPGRPLEMVWGRSTALNRSWLRPRSSNGRPCMRWLCPTEMRTSAS